MLIIFTVHETISAEARSMKIDSNLRENGIHSSEINLPATFSNETTAELKVLLKSVSTGAIIGLILSLIFSWALFLAVTLIIGRFHSYFFFRYNLVER